MKPGLLVAVLLLCQAHTVTKAADGEGWKKISDGYYRFDESIRRFLMSGMDSSYVRLPKTSWEVPVVGRVYGYMTNVTVGGNVMNVGSRPAFEVGAGIGYHGLDAVYTHSVGMALDFNFEFDYYDNYWGLGINICRESFGPELFGELTDVSKTELNCRSILLEGYYAVLGNRFSYPASVYANFIQIKSAGSPLVTFWYEHRDYEALSERARAVFDGKDRYYLNQGALLAGYGYNFSISEGKAVVNLSASVGLPLPYLGIATNGRVAVMYWINDHFRLNANITNFYQKSWSDKNMRLEDNTWRASIGMAYCFGVLDTHR